MISNILEIAFSGYWRKGSYERSIIPKELCVEILKSTLVGSTAPSIIDFIEYAFKHDIT